MSRASRAARSTLTREPVELATVIARAVETVQPMLARQSHEFIVRVLDEPLYLDGDLTRLTQIIGNILSNAIKYTDAGWSHRTQRAHPGRRASRSVCATTASVSIQPCCRRYSICSRRRPRAEGRSQAGLGIGLALVKRLVELHGGEVAGAQRGRRSRQRVHGAAAALRAPDDGERARRARGHRILRRRIDAVEF